MKTLIKEPTWLHNTHLYSDAVFIDGIGWCALVDMLNTCALAIAITQASAESRYCFEHYSDALDSLMSWNGIGDPPGDWIKQKGLGIDRINPNF
jgi:hypothetical protein